MGLPCISVEHTLDRLVEHLHDQRSATGSIHPAEILMQVGVQLDSITVIEYLNFLQDYETLLYEQMAADDQLEPQGNVDWKRVGMHTVGGAVAGGVIGGLYAAAIVAGVLGVGIYTEEKTERTKTDLRPMYLGGMLGGMFGLASGGSALLIAACMYTGLITTGYQQWNNDEKLTERIERFKKSLDSGFSTNVQELKNAYARRIKSLPDTIHQQ